MTIVARGLSVHRSGRSILYPTDIIIEPGERVGLVGASGSGKSTLGHALVDTLRARGQSVALVPQSPDDALDPLRSMQFHWREAERALGLDPDVVRRDALFEALRIEAGDMRKRPWAWSRGMQQRFVIALALLGAPDLLVMDEPTSALDPVVAAGTMNLLDAYLKERQTALLLITHDLGLAAARVSRLIVMDACHVVENAPTETVLATPQTSAAKALCAHRNWLELPC
ncbi:ATP-binding cassette domain-containing protein [Tateyamaria omphalii]|uniref:ATP-binding cassette domain-containing protein n=1 Tax=Tateyamaria omphalii TaxID=299262 RepID=UPI001C98F7BF|nr:ATP-binding cassette domain-containing protein [Tateyamaria omphalii]MBY5934953.1 ATP-binding cassette domain-containing protein [Tateyamaria omphalii]